MCGEAAQFRMIRVRELKREGKLVFLLALPLMVGQVSQMLIGLADTLMLGRLGDVPLAAGAFGITLLMVPLLFGVGIATAVSIKVSQALGSQQPQQAREALRQGLYLAFAFGVLTLLGALTLLPFLGIFRQAPEVTAIVSTFFIIYAFSCIPEMLAMCLRNHANSLNRPWPTFSIVFAGVLLNILFNYLLIFGKWGFPRLELEGAALATLIARSLTFVSLLVWLRRDRSVREWVPQRWLARIDRQQMRGLIKLGLPTSIQVVCEVSAFSAALLIIGSMGAQAVAAHQVVITCAGIVFMIPLGLSMAATVRIGQSIGARDLARIRPIIYSSTLIGFGMFLLTAQPFIFFNNELASMFLPDSPAQPIAATLFLIAAAFQLTDYIQILGAGALRGLSDVNYPAIITIVAYWLISLPLGYLLAFHYDFGVYGIWWGLVLGIFLSAIALGTRVILKTRNETLLRIADRLELERHKPKPIS